MGSLGALRLGAVGPFEPVTSAAWLRLQGGPSLGRGLRLGAGSHHVGESRLEGGGEQLSRLVFLWERHESIRRAKISLEI